MSHWPWIIVGAVLLVFSVFYASAALDAEDSEHAHQSWLISGLLLAATLLDANRWLKPDGFLSVLLLLGTLLLGLVAVIYAFHEALWKTTGGGELVVIVTATLALDRAPNQIGAFVFEVILFLAALALISAARMKARYYRS